MWLGFGKAVQHWGTYAPDKIAIRIGSSSYNYSTFYQRSLMYVNYLLKRRIRGRIGIAASSNFEYLSAIAGAKIIGNPVIIMNPLESKESLKVHIADTTPEIIFGNKELIKSVNPEMGVEIIDCEEISVNEDMPQSPIKTDEWGVLFSSGSTGISKAIIYNHETLTSELLAWVLELGITRNSKFYIGRPISYTGGLVLSLATLLVGGEVLYPIEKTFIDFDKIFKDYCRTISEYIIDYAFFVPDQLRYFCNQNQIHIPVPPKTPTILVMGAKITANEKIEAHKKLHSDIIESWGNTEGLGTITDKGDLKNRPESIGRPFLTEDIYIVNDEFEKCPENQNGRLAGSDETMFVEYANRPDATSYVKNNHLILSDDIGYKDKDGYFYILGRVQESFVIGKKTVFLTDLEDKIRVVEGIEDVCVISITKKSNPVFAAIIVKKTSAGKDRIIEHINKKTDVQFDVFNFVNELPRLSSGKINRLKVSQGIVL